MVDIVVAVVIGLATGYVGGYAGIGGAPFIIFLLTLLLGFSQHEAQGTVLAMMLGPISLLAVINSWELIKPKLNVIIICVITYAITSFFGGLAAYIFPSAELERLFGILLIVIGFTYATLYLERFIAKRKLIELSSSSIIPVGVAVGFFGGMFGIGAGILLVPIFTAFYGLEQNEARAMSLAILLPPVSLGAVVQYGLVNADINIVVAFFLFISYLVSNGRGYSAGQNQSPDKLKRILGALLVVAGVISFVMAK